MAEPQLAATVSPVPTGPVQPATQQADDGFERVPRDEYQTLKRNSERARGMEAFFQAANKHGFKRPEDLEPIGKLTSTLKNKGLTVDQVAQLLADERQEEAQASPGGGFDPKAAEKWAKEQGFFTEKDYTQREARLRASFEHKEALAKEQAAMEKCVAEMTGEKATEYDKRAIRAMLKEMADQKRGIYPVGHPLGPVQGENGLAYDHAEFTAHDEKTLAEIVSEIKKLRGTSEGDALVAQADAALKGGKKVPTPAGAPGTGTKTAPKAADQSRREGNLPPKAAVEAAYAKRVAARGGGAVSSMGG